MSYRNLYNNLIFGALFIAGCGSPQYTSLREAVNQSCRGSNRSGFTVFTDKTRFIVEFKPEDKDRIPGFCGQLEHKVGEFINSRRQMANGVRGLFLSNSRYADITVYYYER